MAAVGASTATEAQRPAPARAAALPPGPRLPALLQTIAWATVPTVLLDRCAAALGDAFTIKFWPSGMRMVMLSDPDAVKELFTTPPELAPSGAARSPIASVLGPSSVIVLTGPEHIRQRRLLLPPFHGERMREYEQVMAEAARRDLEEWPLGRPMRVLPRTRRITLEVILRAVFGVEGERKVELKQAIGELLAPAGMVRVLRVILSRDITKPPGGAIGRALERLDGLIFDELRTRRALPAGEERGDILSLLLEARDEDGNAMSDAELRDELLTLLLAGHETTATSLAWAVERLVRNPRVLARLQRELDEGEGEEYLAAVVNETLRVRPVVPIVVRSLTADLPVGPHVLPAGTRAAPCIWLTNHNPAVYEQPREFRPERFLGQAPDTFAWIPFGGGIRRCIGASFAQLEMRVILRTVLSELQPHLPPLTLRRRGERVRRRAITLVPAGGARVVWERRSLR